MAPVALGLAGLALCPGWGAVLMQLGAWGICSQAWKGTDHGQG